jgi:hypothetical protein
VYTLSVCMYTHVYTHRYLCTHVRVTVCICMSMYAYACMISRGGVKVYWRVWSATHLVTHHLLAIRKGGLWSSCISIALRSIIKIYRVESDMMGPGEGCDLESS